MFLIFNRQDTTSRVFAAIRAAQPRYLYIAADGPRADKVGEAELCAQTRKLVLDAIDWDCEVHTLFRDYNLGCGRAVSEAINWFFKNVEQGIILEDDCLPSESFFAFCEKMLNLYRDEDQVKIISGTNYLFSDTTLHGDDYFFSKYFSIWGWASWRRVITSVTWENAALAKTIRYSIFKRHFLGDKVLAKWLYKMVKDTVHSKIDTWDSKFVYNLILQKGLSIVPLKNMISNIGIVGTHANGAELDNQNTETYNIVVSDMRKKVLKIDETMNKRVFENIKKYINPPPSLLSSYVSCLRSLLKW